MFNENDLTVENMKFLSREAALKENTRISELKNNVITAAFNSVKSQLSNEFGTSITLDSPKTNLTEFTPNTLSGKIVATLSVDTIDGVKRVPVTFKVRASVAKLAESMDEIKDKLDKAEGSLESEIREIMSSQESKIKAKEEESKLARQVESDLINGISLDASRKNRIFKEAKKEEIDMHTIQENPIGNALPPQILTYPKAYLPEMKKDKSIINVGGFKYKYIGDEPTITGDTENGVIARFALIPIGKKASLNKIAEGSLVEKLVGEFDDFGSPMFSVLNDGTIELDIAYIKEEDINKVLDILNDKKVKVLDSKYTASNDDFGTFVAYLEEEPLEKSAEDETVEGWSNYSTWNVALWIDNSRPLYEQLVEYVNQEENPTYDGLISFLGLEDGFTEDGVSFQGKELNKSELDNWIKNHKDELSNKSASLNISAADYSSMTSGELKEFVKPYVKSKSALPKDLAEAITFFPSVVSDYASQLASISDLETSLTDGMKEVLSKNPKDAYNVFNKLSKGKDFDSFPEFIKSPILDNMDILQDFAKKNPDSLSESIVNAISENPNVMLELVDNGNINLPEEVKKKFSDRLIEEGYATKEQVEENYSSNKDLSEEEQQAQKDIEDDHIKQEKQDNPDGESNSEEVVEKETSKEEIEENN